MVNVRRQSMAWQQEQLQQQLGTFVPVLARLKKNIWNLESATQSSGTWSEKEPFISFTSLIYVSFSPEQCR